MLNSELISRKIFKSVDDFVPELTRIRFKNMKLVFTNGCFDVLHRGHVDYLSAAADLGNFLVVGINSDPSVRRLKGENRPINPLEARCVVLASLQMIDAVIVFEDDTPLTLIQNIKPNVLVKGGDYTPGTIVGAREVSDLGGQVFTIPLTPGFSTTGIENRLKSKI